MSTDPDRIVSETLLEICQRRSAAMKEIKPSMTLIQDLGLQSMDIAELVATLEMKFSADPFGSGEVSITSIRTVGDLVAAYRKVLKAG